MNWIKPTTEKYPQFKKIVLGLQLPNKVELVKLDRIDENGPVFVRAYGRGLVSEFAAIFSGSDFETANKENVKVDMYAEITLPEVSEKSESKTEAKKEEEQPLNS
jgi:hypothetical protein